MIEIRTIIVPATHPGKFDDEVNAHLKEGWELVRRDTLPPFEGECTAAPRCLYAELERAKEEPETTEEDEDENSSEADWNIVRDPIKPYKCSSCGYKAAIQWPTCPYCSKAMRRIEL